MTLTFFKVKGYFQAIFLHFDPNIANMSVIVVPYVNTRYKIR